MKAAAVFLLVLATIAVLVLLDRPAKINPIPFRVLQEGETNPPLRQVGTAWPLPIGTRLWLKTNQEPCAVVVNTVEDMVYLVDPVDGKPFTLMQRYVRHHYRESKGNP
jgi:hypothetical protein